MKTIEEIENYIKEQEQNGALLVTGKWGSGKTYLMRQIERKLNQGPQYLMAVVSLFGIEDTNTLIKKVKEAVVYAQTFNKAEKSGKGHIAKGVNVVKQLSEKVAAFGELFDFGKIKKIAKSANMLLSIDVYDFLPIEKEVYCIVAGEEQPVKKKLVLVFDDFERCKIGVIDLLGIINTYSLLRGKCRADTLLYPGLFFLLLCPRHACHFFNKCARFLIGRIVMDSKLVADVKQKFGVGKFVR